MPDNRPALAAWLAFLAATLFFLFLSVKVMESKRWR